MVASHNNQLNSEGLPKGMLFNLMSGKATVSDSLIKAATAIVTNRLAEKGANRVGGWTEKIAARYTDDEKRIAQAGNLAENIWRAVVPLIPTIFKGATTLHKDLKNYFELKEDFRPVLAAKGGNVTVQFLGSNAPEMIRNARSEMAGITKNNLKRRVVQAILTLPSMLSAQVDKLIETLKDDRKNTRRSETDALQEMREKARDKIHGAFDKTLDFLTVNKDRDEREDREYNWLAKIAVEELTSNYTIEDLEKPANRRHFLSNAKARLFNQAMIGVVAGSEPWLNQQLRVKSEDAYAKATAWKMTKALDVALKKNPSLVRVSGLPGAKEEMRLEEYIVAIFRQHQLDCGRPEIAAKLDDDLEEAAKIFAQAMTDPHRRLSPLALVDATDAGNRTNCIFGFEGGHIASVKDCDELSAFMQKQIGAGVTHRKRSNSKQYYHERSEIFTREDFLECWEGLTPDEKDIWSSFFPDEVLLDAGVTKQELTGLRCRANDYWEEVVGAGLEKLGSIREVELKELGFTNKQITDIRDLVKEFTRGNKDAIHKHRATAMDVTAQLGIAMERERPGFLSELLESGRIKKEKEHRSKRHDENLTFSEQVKHKSGHHHERDAR